MQPKLSLNLHKHEGCNRLTIVGLWGDFIFKPQTDDYPELPENEDLTMHMAEAARIKVVPHSLIRLADGSLGIFSLSLSFKPSNPSNPNNPVPEQS